VWINSHWQQNDIFELAGGDPTVVTRRVSAVHAALDLTAPLALHWYEWDRLGYKEGSNYTECASEETCGFDTHYPEYFPERDGFNQTMAALRELDPPVRLRS
jgi:hypothetical protein